jgi:hypothetical protein
MRRQEVEQVPSRYPGNGRKTAITQVLQSLAAVPDRLGKEEVNATSGNVTWIWNCKIWKDRKPNATK